MILVSIPLSSSSPSFVYVYGPPIVSIWKRSLARFNYLNHRIIIVLFVYILSICWTIHLSFSLYLSLHLYRLEQSIQELHRLFLDMAILVEAQQELMDQIEHNVVTAASYIKQGAKELAKANKLQKKSRKVSPLSIHPSICSILLLSLSIYQPFFFIEMYILYIHIIYYMYRNLYMYVW